MEKARKKLVEYCRKMVLQKLTNGTSGNLSIIDREKNTVAITPSGVDYLSIDENDIVIIDLDGNVIEGDKKVSSEYELHLAIYLKDKTVGSVVHTHSTFCTTFACLRQPLKAAHYLIASTNASIVPCVEYHTYGTIELAKAVSEIETESKALLLANHGMVAYAETIDQAFNIAENVEWCAEILWRAQTIGKPITLSDNEIKKVIEKFNDYGQSDKKSGY
ncbi:MAG: L-fuculose-phosphate aldolase [Anaerorhabdus sp.]